MAEPGSLPWYVVEDRIGIGKLRIAAPDAETRLSRSLGFDCPAAGRMTRGDQLACLRLGPQEWLLTGDHLVVRDALARAEEFSRDALALVLDMSHGGKRLHLWGAQAAERIASYCDLDLANSSFPAGCATRTRFGDISVTLARLDDQPSFWIIVDQSHTEYLTQLLGHGA